ncbi:MAG: hypothetical protein MK135_03225 [Polyangiaceae bacterium]|nr:hypothetical protein [Polyangiaceae bacterium]
MIRSQEANQFAADATAFGATAMLARSMNLLALLNQIMMVVLAVLVALRLAQTFFIIATVILSAAAWFSFGATAPLASVCAQMAHQMGTAYRQARPQIYRALEGLNLAEQAVIHLAPGAAIAVSVAESRHHPHSEWTAALPSTLTLPAEEDEFPVLCGKSTSLATWLALAPLSPILPNAILKKVSQGSENMGRDLSGFLCGKAGSHSASPTTRRLVEEHRPQPFGLKSCETMPKAQACAQAQEEQRLARPDSASGACLAHHQCTFQSPYEELARRARSECDPTMEKDLSQFIYQTHPVEQQEQFLLGRWQETERRYLEPTLHSTSSPPCGKKGDFGKDWNTLPTTHQTPDPLYTPLCDSRASLRNLNQSGQEGERRTRTFFQVTRLFGCTKTYVREFSLADEGDEIPEQSQKAGRPHRIQADLQFGAEEFQVRAVSGKRGINWEKSEQVRKAGTWNHENQLNAGNAVPGSSQSSWHLLKSLPQVSFAQGEYFFGSANELPESEWLWEMHWRARLDRFLLPEQRGEEEETSISLCQLHGSLPCSSSSIAELKDWMLH